MIRTGSAVRSCQLAQCANELREGTHRPPDCQLTHSSPPCLLSQSRPIAFMFAFQHFGVGVGMGMVVVYGVVCQSGLSSSWPNGMVGRKKMGDEVIYQI